MNVINTTSSVWSFGKPAASHVKAFEEKWKKALPSASHTMPPLKAGGGWWRRGEGFYPFRFPQ